MREDIFTVSNVLIDYNLLGYAPEGIDKLKYNKIIDKLMEVFQYTFTNTAFCYYGTLADIRFQIEESPLLEEIEITKYSKKKQWFILVLFLEKMFLDMHDTKEGSDFLNLVFDNLDNLDETDLKVLIEDINYGIFFAVEENLLVSPTSLKEVKATIETTLVLKEILDKENDFYKVISNSKVATNIDKSRYEEITKIPFNVKTYKKIFFNSFLFKWIDLMDKKVDFIESKKKLTKNDIDDINADIFATILTFNGLFFPDKDYLLNITEEMYEFVEEIFLKKYNIEDYED